MTVIAWDGTTLAADKRMCIGSHHMTTTKIFRRPECLIAFSGAAKNIGALLVWVDGGKVVAEFPKIKDDEQTIMALIYRDGRIENFDSGPFAIMIEDHQHAMGSGRDYARAAMYLGETAREACIVACQFDEACGNGIDVLSFADE